MKKIFLIVCACLAVLLIQPVFSSNLVFADSVDEYIESAYELMNQGDYEKALAVLEEGYNQNPGPIALVFMMAECYYGLGDYQTAIGNFINILTAIESTGDEAPEVLHENLIRAYNSLGQRHHFTEELSLRIIYHTEKFLQKIPELARSKEYMEFLRKSIGHYDMAKIGAKMLETGGDGEDFDLLDDGISNDKKLSFKEKAEQRLAEFDSKERAEVYQAVSSDKSVDEIVDVINKKVEGIQSIHFKKSLNDSGQVVEEVYFQRPGQFKALTKGVTSIVNNGVYYVIDDASKKIVDKQPLDISEADVFQSLFLPNLNKLSEYYDFKVEMLSQPPEFVKSIYESNSSDSLYLLTGTLKEGAESPYYPEVIKVEHVIDAQLGLSVGIRHYWPGILGSGRVYDLAYHMAVNQVESISGISLPKSGATVSHVNDLTGVNESWSLEVLKLNQELNEEEFSIEAFNK